MYRISQRNGKALRFLSLIVLITLLLSLFAGCSGFGGKETTPTTTEPSGSSEPQPTSPPETTLPPETTVPPTEPTEPYIVSTASVGVMGDVLMHSPLINSGSIGGGKYDFSNMFIHVEELFGSVDFMVANLETTLGGKEAGEYSGYPHFNCPDEIVQGLFDAGVDMLLTANNHTYDTGKDGMLRTLQELENVGMLHLGTRTDTSEPFYTIQNINGIRVGMICYTYETNPMSDGRKCLNGIPLSQSAGPLVNSFDYNDLSGFYAELQDFLNQMYVEEIDMSMVYIHWGEEYQLSANKTQKAIAQQLCEMGVDVIVGGHPHVVQPFDTLTSSTGHKTYCMYSTGNAISNQRRDLISQAPNGHSEDGVFFQVTFQKWNDGTTEVCGIDIVPTWVNREWLDNGRLYQIIPLDPATEDWSAFGISSGSAEGSYKRTMAIVGEGLNECREALGQDTVPLTMN